jgi:hypoxanthine phosphoribosyltransferase
MNTKLVKLLQAVTIHDQSYEYLSWEHLGNEIFSLSQKIAESNVKYDRVVALAKGGLTFARSLTDYLDVDHLSSIQIQMYSGINQTMKKPIVLQSLPVSIQDENILVFDDIVDKGDTMALSLEYLSYHGAKSLTTACLVKKPWTNFQPDFFASESKSWIIFPNESRETIHLLQDMWLEKGDSLEEITKNLLKIGFPKAEVEFFTQVR